MLLLALLASCAKAPAPTDGSPMTSVPEASAEMLDHFVLASRAQEAVINGDLDGARMAGKAIAGMNEPASFPSGYEAPYQVVRDRAVALEGAETLNEAAARVAEIGAACGTCHAATNAGPKLDAAALPQAPWETVEHMPRHKWAADWMWLGLVSPSEAAWRQGATALSGVPVFDPGQPAEYARQEAQVHDLAAQAVDADAGDRPLLYAQFIAACSECHAP